MVITTSAQISLLDSIQAEDFHDDEAARNDAIAAAYKLIHRLQHPAERLHYITFHQPVIVATLLTLQDLGLWAAWAADGEETKSLQALATMADANVDLNLLRRLCRLMASVDVLDEVAEDRYKLTRLTKYLGGNQGLGPMQLQAWADHWEIMGKSIPAFLRKTSFQEPHDPTNTSYRDGNPESLEFWSRLTSNPSLQRSFGGFMEAWSRQKRPWPEYFDTNLLLESIDPSTPIVVDVGGNVGLDLESFLAKHPDVPPGALVLQDRPEALKLAKTNEKIKIAEYDFFTPQPVIGSRAYFFHAVFHDWDNKESLEILQNLASAMKKGYSKLLICDIVLPPTGASVLQAAMDMQMLGLVSAGERTEAAWKELLENSGFKVVKLWPDGRGYEMVIEAELA
ncbi:putative O-methyltransferase [Thozetella sp. PMI_491]|nr:putative O-methyltransferase [Thozetella sp. PMI_491]